MKKGNIMEEKKVMAIVGLSKNAGKTSLLNWYLKNLEGQKIGVSTTGRDGEDTDLLTKLPKPKVILPKDVYFTSFENVFSKHAIMIEGIEKLPFRVIDKHLWLYKTLGEIETEIVGPSTVKEQTDLIDIFQNYGCELTIIDGSFDRKSISFSDKITDLLLVIGASAGSIENIKRLSEKLKIYSMFETYSPPLPPPYLNRGRSNGRSSENSITYSLNNQLFNTELNSIFGNESAISDILKQNPEWLHLSGAMTEISWQKLKDNIKDYKGKIVFNHPLNISLGFNDLKYLLDSQKVFTRKRFPISAVAVNSFSTQNKHIDAETLRNEVKAIFEDMPIIDVMEIAAPQSP